MKKTLLALALAVAAGGAQAIDTQTTLTSPARPGGSITAGDKLFSNWSDKPVIRLMAAPSTPPTSALRPSMTAA
jgi:hypothetical protein